MSEFSGSYMRFTSDHNFPSTRPHNKYLATAVVDSPDLESSTERNLIDGPRPSNPLAEEQHDYKRTLYDREANDQVKGGAIKNPGWDPRHPRLSRNPNWYEGRGKERAEKVAGTLGSIALALL
tara:strand:+ start:177 stop:545 length:369 start_codon:yes stop_codon:yes gene_type:complete